MKSPPVLLVVGCGDVGLRLLPWVVGRWRVRVLTSSATRVGELRAAGVVPNLLRVSAGIEHIDDIKADFEQAFTKVGLGGSVLA